MAKNQNELSSELLNYHPETNKQDFAKTQAGRIIKSFITISSLIFIDLMAIGLAVFTALMMRLHILPHLSVRFNNYIPAEFWDHIWWVIIVWILCLLYEGLYAARISFWRESLKVVEATAIAFLLIMTVIFLAKLGGEFSRTTLVLTFIMGLAFLPLGRYLGKNLLAKFGLWNEPVLILGAGQTGIMIARSLENEPYIGYKVFGFLEDDPAKRRKKGVKVNDVTYCILGGFTDAGNVISENSIRKVILAAPGMPGRELVNLTNQLKSFTHSVLVVPDLIGMSVAGGRIDYLSNDQIVAYSICNNLANPENVIIKRLFDILLGLCIFIILLPLLIIIAIAVKLDSPGPIGFSHKRVGHNGEYFPCYKFRTMVSNAEEILQELLKVNPALKEEWERDFKLKDDPRVTKIGKFLRKTSLDELPQIFNVLRGEMSLVGPRPIVEDEIPKFGECASDYFMVLPGMTGLWGVSGRSDTDYKERVQMETWYVRNWSMWLDITLLIRTVGVVLGRKGAY